MRKIIKPTVIKIIFTLLFAVLSYYTFPKEISELSTRDFPWYEDILHIPYTIVVSTLLSLEGSVSSEGGGFFLLFVGGLMLYFSPIVFWYVITSFIIEMWPWPVVRAYFQKR